MNRGLFGFSLPPNVSPRGSSPRSARTALSTLAPNDRGSLIDITSGTFAQLFQPAGNLGAGWYCYIRNSGSGDITLTPVAGQFIDALSSYVMYPGEARLITCDGVSGFTSVILNPFYRVYTASAAGGFVTPAGYRMFQGLLWHSGAGGGCNPAASSAGGGGGGGCVPFLLPSSAFGTSTNVVIAAGGIGSSTNAVAAGNGSLSSLGPLVTAGCVATGGAGGNGYGGGVGSSQVIPIAYPAVNLIYDGSSVTFGPTVYGGGYGGWVNTSVLVAAGTSTVGGNGGAGSLAGPGSNGIAPGGGGGATGAGTGTKGGDGARGELRIWGVV